MSELRREEVCSIEEANAIAFGSKSKKQDLNFDFLPFKLPKELLSDEIRIKVHYIGLCHTDVSLANGFWGDFVEIPSVPGHEFIGEVIELGNSVTNLKKGDIVGYAFIGKTCGECIHCLKGNDNLCKSIEDVLICNPHFGGWASHYQGKAKFAHKIPDTIPLENAAPLMCAGLTVYAPMKRFLKEGQHVAIVGIGGLGHIAIKIAKAMGMKVTAISTSPEKIEAIKKLGADNVVLYKDLDKLQKIKDIDAVICCISEGSIDEYLKILRQRGLFIMLGLPPCKKEFLQIDIHYLVLNEIMIVGSNVGNRQEVDEMLDFCAKNKCFPNVEVFNFDDFPTAVEHLQNEKPLFRCVVKCLSTKYPKFNSAIVN